MTFANFVALSNKQTKSKQATNCKTTQLLLNSLRMNSSTNAAHLVHVGIQQFSQGFVHFHRGDIPKTIELVEKGIGTLLIAYKKGSKFFFTKTFLAKKRLRAFR
jgi:hypothetical protein